MVRGGSVLAARTAGRVLRDPVLDAELRHTGFVVTRVLDPRAAADIRAGFGAMHGWEMQSHLEIQPADFEIATWSSDLDYRAQISDLIDRETAGPLARLFVRHRPVGRSIMVKWPARPGQPDFDGVPDAFHNDSQFIDERTGARSFMIWMALQPISPANGGLLVVPYSHRLDRTIRGWGVAAPWLSHASVYERYAVPLTLDAGEAVIFDPALIHRSGPNPTDEARVAASLLVVEPGVPMCIFRRSGDAAAEKVEISRRFFVEADYAEAFAWPSVEELELDVPDRTEEWVARRLNWCAASDRVRRRVLSTVRFGPSPRGRR